MVIARVSLSEHRRAVLWFGACTDRIDRCFPPPMRALLASLGARGAPGRRPRGTTAQWQARGRSSSRACCLAAGCAASHHRALWQPPSQPQATSSAKRSGRGESSLTALVCSCARRSGMRSKARHCRAGTHFYTGFHRRRWVGGSSGTTPLMRRWPSRPSWRAPQLVQGASRGSACSRSCGRQYVRTVRSSRQLSLRTPGWCPRPTRCSWQTLARSCGPPCCHGSVIDHCPVHKNNRRILSHQRQLLGISDPLAALRRPHTHRSAREYVWDTHTGDGGRHGRVYE